MQQKTRNEKQQRKSKQQHLTLFIVLHVFVSAQTQHSGEKVY